MFWGCSLHHKAERGPAAHDFLQSETLVCPGCVLVAGTFEEDEGGGSEYRAHCGKEC